MEGEELVRSEESPSKPKRLILAVVFLHVSAAVGVLAAAAIAVVCILFGSLNSGLMSFVFSEGKTPAATPVAPSLGGYGFIVVLALVGAVLYAVAAEVAVWGLNRRRYWAWVTGIVLAGGQILTGWQYVIQAALGGLILWGLLDRDTVAAFRRGRKTDN